MPSVARVKFIKTKVIFRCHTKGVSNQVSSNSDHEIKSYSCSNSSTKMGKNEKEGKQFRLQNRAIRGLQIWAGSRDYKSGQEGLKREEALGISDRGKKITNWSKEISNRGRDYKSGREGFQIEAGITNQRRDYKSGQRDFKLGQR